MPFEHIIRRRVRRLAVSTRVDSLLLLGLLVVAPGAGAAPPPDPATRVREAAPPPGDPDTLFSGVAVLDRHALVRAVLDGNPSLEAARQAWASAVGRIPREGRLPDPQVEYEMAPLSVGSDEVPYGHTIRLRQGFPFFGNLGLAREAAEAEAEMEADRWDAVRLRLAATTSDLYDAYYLVHRAIAINRAHEALLRDLQAGVLARYEAGSATLVEPLRIDVELAHLEHETLELDTEGDLVQAEINALLHRHPTLPLPDPPATLLPPEPRPEPADSLRAAALRHRPELRAAEAAVRGREARERLAGRAALPDLMVMGQYSSMWMETEHRWMVGVGIGLPLWGRGGDADAATAERLRAERERDVAEDEVLLEVETARKRLELDFHHLELYRNRILPASRDRLAAARGAYEAGRLGFPEVIEAEQALRVAELDMERTVAMSHRNLTALARATGRLGAWIDEGAAR